MFEPPPPPTPQRQVLPAKGHAVSSEPTREQAQQAMAEWQRKCSAVMSKQNEAARKSRLKAAKTTMTRAVAHDHMRCLDHALQLAGLSLDTFRGVGADGRVLGSLTSSQQRYFVPWLADFGFSDPEGVTPQRSAIKDTGGTTTWFELPPSCEPMPCLTLTINQGSTMYSATWFMMYHLKLRLVTFADPMHRTWNDVLLAVGASDLRYLICEYIGVLNLPFGP